MRPPAARHSTFAGLAHPFSLGMRTANVRLAIACTDRNATERGTRIYPAWRVIMLKLAAAIGRQQAILGGNDQRS